MRKYIYLKITRDRLELPLFVADTIREMAEHEGKTENNIKSQISKHEHGVNNFCQYRRVPVEQE